jgi:hypothetical protein
MNMSTLKIVMVSIASVTVTAIVSLIVVFEVFK